MNAITPELERLRAEDALPFRGKPARVQILFKIKDIEDRFDRPSLNRWWNEEAVPVIQNLTGGRAKIEFGRVWVDDEKTAINIRLFFHGFVFGILDWHDMRWIIINEDIPLPTSLS